MDFEWNRQKAEANIQKHGVTFDEASSVFGGMHYQLHFQALNTQFKNSATLLLDCLTKIECWLFLMSIVVKLSE